MKLSYIFAVLAIVILVGCAQKTTAPVETPPPPPVVEAPPAIEPEPPKEIPAEIEILVRGFEPEEITVKKGATVRWINTAPGPKIITINGVSSPRLESGDTYEQTFEAAGEQKIFDLFGRKWGKVIVAEE